MKRLVELLENIHEETKDVELNVGSGWSAYLDTMETFESVIDYFEREMRRTKSKTLYDLLGYYQEVHRVYKEEETAREAGEAKFGAYLDRKMGY